MAKDGFRLGSSYIEITADLSDDFRGITQAKLKEALADVHASVKIEPNVDQARFRSEGAAAGSGFSGGLADKLGGGGGLAGTIAALALPALATLPALVGVAGAATGVAFGAALAIAGSKELQKQGSSLLASVKTVAENAAKQLDGPIAQAMDSVSKQLPNIGKLLTGTFKAVAPDVLPLVNMLTGLVTNVLPGFNRMLQAVAGPFAGFAKIIGTVVASNLGSFFSNLGPGMAAAVRLLGSILSSVSLLLPPIAKLASTLAISVGPAIASVVGFLARFLAGLITWVAKNPVVVQAITALMIAWKALNIVMALNPWVAIIAALVIAAYEINKYHELIWQTILSAWGKITSFLHTTWSSIINDLSGAWNTVYQDTDKAWAKVANDIHGAWATIINGITGAYHTVENNLVGAWNDITGGVKTAWGAIANFFSGWWSKLKTDVGNWVGNVKTTLSNAWDAIKNTASTVWNTIANFFSTWWDKTKSQFSTAVNAVKNALSTAWTNIKNDVSTTWNAITSFFSTWWGKLKSDVSTDVGNVRSTLSKAWSDIKSDAVTAWGAIATGIGNAFKAVGNAVLVPVNGLLDLVGKFDSLIDHIPGVNLPKSFAHLSFAQGGILPGYMPGHDIIPAMLSPGEAVLTPGASLELGHTTIARLNARNAPGMPAHTGMHNGVLHAAAGVVPVPGTPAAAAAAQAALNAKTQAAATGPNVLGVLANDVTSLLADPVKWLAANAVKALTAAIPGGGLGLEIAKGAASAIITAVESLVAANPAGNGPAPAGGATGSEMANGRELYKYLLTNLFGGNKFAAAGAIASIWGESTWNPFAQGTGGRGLIGWTPPGTISDADFKGGMATQEPAILRFVTSSGDSGVIAEMFRATSVLDAANLWGKGVERYGINDVHSTGLALATQIMNGKAAGGIAPGGQMTLVGENGPELIRPSSSTSVYSNAKSQQMMGSGVTVNQYYTGPQMPTAEQREQMKLEMGYALAPYAD